MKTFKEYLYEMALDFGDSPEHINKHIILSKTELNIKGK